MLLLRRLVAPQLVVLDINPDDQQRDNGSYHQNRDYCNPTDLNVGVSLCVQNGWVECSGETNSRGAVVEDGVVLFQEGCSEDDACRASCGLANHNLANLADGCIWTINKISRAGDGVYDVVECHSNVREFASVVRRIERALV